jgi:hypothetical protein
MSYHGIGFQITATRCARTVDLVGIAPTLRGHAPSEGADIHLEHARSLESNLALGKLDSREFGRLGPLLISQRVDGI